jgi:hypothetical protein
MIPLTAQKCHPAVNRAQRTAVGQECPAYDSGFHNTTPSGETDRRELAPRRSLLRSHRTSWGKRFFSVSNVLCGFRALK